MNKRKNIVISNLKISAVFAFILMSLTSNAQLDTRINMPHYDDKPIHFGYLLGLNYSTFKITHSDDFVNSDTLNSVAAIGKTGFEVGFIFNLRLGEYFDARVLPKVSFYERGVNYYFKNTSDPLSSDFQSSFIEVPILLKYKSHRRKNLRVYMVGGIKPAFEVGAKKRQKRNDAITTKTFNLSLDYGIGLDLYYPFFKFSPELRFSLGMLDILKQSDNIYSSPIKRMTPYNITFAILFE